MQPITILISLIELFTFAFASDAGLPYKIELAQFTTTISGQEVQYNGTVQEVYARILELHPDFNLPAARSGTIDLKHRATAENDGILCIPVRGQPWTRCSADAIRTGVRYLNGIKSISVNGRSCGRISCAYKSAIYVCNDNSETITQAGRAFAGHAQDIVDHCSTQRGKYNQEYTGGQEFDTDKYNIIVRLDTDHC